MIREYFESRVAAVELRIEKLLSRNGVFAVVRGSWLEFLYLLLLTLMSAGAVSALASPVNQSYMIYPSPSGETISEMVIYAMATLMGFGGFYLSYLSGRQTTNRRLIGFFLALGLILIAVATYIELYVFTAK